MVALDEKRQFHRVTFGTHACLIIGGNECPCDLLDLSLRGALVQLSTNDLFDQGSIGKLTFNLGEDLEQIEMDVQIIRAENQRIGLSCINIDIDSISHLRRLIELNTGDSCLLDRELHQLFQI